MNNNIIEFKEYLTENFNSKRQLTPVQKVVEFYFWIKKLDKDFEPFERHVRAAKKIIDWSDGDLDKALGLVAFVSEDMTAKNLNYTLDTAFRMVPDYNVHIAIENKWQAEDGELRENSRRLIEEGRAWQEELKRRKSDPEYDDDDIDF
jgi:hypothetical protein